MAIRNLRSEAAALIVALAATLAPCVVNAQIEKRIVFSKTRTTFTLRGKLPRNSDYDTYFFAAKKGQTLTVKVVNRGGVYNRYALNAW